MCTLTILEFYLKQKLALSDEIISVTLMHITNKNQLVNSCKEEAKLFSGFLPNGECGWAAFIISLNKPGIHIFPKNHPLFCKFCTQFIFGTFWLFILRPIFIEWLWKLLSRQMVYYNKTYFSKCFTCKFYKCYRYLISEGMELTTMNWFLPISPLVFCKTLSCLM